MPEVRNVWVNYRLQLRDRLRFAFQDKRHRRSARKISSTLRCRERLALARDVRKHDGMQLIQVPMSLVKSKQRVADHGEVFTPPWMVEAMLDLVKDETDRIDSRFLEPACVSGNFLVQVLRRKLAAVELKFGKSNFEKQNYALSSR